MKHFLLWPLAVSVWGALLWHAQAGSGTIDSTAKTVDLTVLFTFSEATENLDGAANPTWRQVFNAGSRRLWNATNGQLRIGKITVYVRAADKKDLADVWISRGDHPAFSTDVGVLNVPGQHMQFFPKHRDLTVYLGDCSIAHEIGHYILNLFDEYIGYSVPLARKDNFTMADVRVELNSSPFLHSISPMDTVTSLMDAGGGVVPANRRTEFDTASNVTKGVAGAGRWWMTKHWFLRRESCWETMAKLNFNGQLYFQDIPIGASPNSEPPGFVDIEWKVIPTLCRLSLCVDRSESMLNDNKLRLALTGAKIFTNLTQEQHTVSYTNAGGAEEGTIIFRGDELAVVGFNDVADPVYPLHEMDPDEKTNARSAIATLFAEGHTAIGDGLQASLDQITSAGDPVTQEAIILLTDGFKDTGSDPLIAAVNCAARHVKVYTIALGPGADTGLLAGLAGITGGRFFQASDATTLLDLYPAILAELKGNGLVTSAFDVAHEEEQTNQTVTVDPFTEEVTFSLGSISAGFHFALKSPKGKVYTASVPADGVSFEQSDTEAHFLVSNPTPGKWVQFVTAPKGVNAGVVENFRYALTTTANTQLVNVRAATTQDTYAFPDPIVVHCTVTAGSPVGGAEVSASVTGPDGALSYVTLYDDGLPEHADATANDGVYSASFLPFAGSGVYTIEVTANNKAGKEAITNPESTGKPFVPQPIKPFIRMATTTTKVTGAAASKIDWMRVDALTILKDKKNPAIGKVTATIEFNAPNGQIDPTTDFLNVVLGTHYFVITPGALTAMKTPGVYKISNTANNYQLTGTLQLGIGGSSRGRLVVTKGNFDLSGTPFAATLDVKLIDGNIPLSQIGTFQQVVALQPLLSPAAAPTKLSYVSKRNYSTTPTLFFDGIKATVNHAVANRDTLRIVSTFQGGGENYDPATQDADLALGGFALHLPATTLVKGRTNVCKGKVVVGAGSVQVSLDLKNHICIVSGAKLALNGRVDRTMGTSLVAGSFDQSGVLTVQQTVRGKVETLVY